MKYLVLLLEIAMKVPFSLHSGVSGIMLLRFRGFVVENIVVEGHFDMYL
jgi:hypothetical protein